MFENNNKCRVSTFITGQGVYMIKIITSLNIATGSDHRGQSRFVQAAPSRERLNDFFYR